MTKTILMATTAMFLSAGAAMAQTPSPAPAQNAPQAEAGQQGVLVFAPDFFADQQPTTALDMVNRVPGFSVVDGDGSRGFEGSVGNVLINGSRPASKNDTGSSVLGRTLAANVERIELVRGGAPGIDMQGFSVVANVITRNQSSMQTIVTGNAVLFEGGPDAIGVAHRQAVAEGEAPAAIAILGGELDRAAICVGPTLEQHRVAGDDGLHAGLVAGDHIGDDGEALHVNPGRAAPDELDPFDVGGEGAAKDAGAGVVLGRR
ncbi:MAG: hypothetical protein EON96_19655, partial [Caulobacteraceae bacterium]